MVRSKRGGSHDVGLRRKFPAWVQYANEAQRFDEPSRENLAWAKHIIGQISPDLSFVVTNTRLTWHLLKVHQPVFVRTVEHLATGRLTYMEMKVISERGQLRFRCERPSPRGVRAPLKWCWIDCRDYAPRWVAREPVDGLYWQLQEWLRQDPYRYLTRCAACERFFLQRTPAADTCSPACRRRAHPPPQNPQATQKRLDRQEKLAEDLQRVRKLKAQWRQAHPKVPLELSPLLTALGMTHQRWAILKKAERQQRGKLWYTDLTR